ncbi:hypothetical protein VN97_g2302 [Penicillium thymicola]|uniref:Uncharacterized protein n=1 Tax=Penicillium thymicola TaxID=293382 RepID=A0AAI9TPU7_PENTH|nr:hypothetical protein VN97_g2302 [Penicillium thymicola]
MPAFALDLAPLCSFVFFFFNCIVFWRFLFPAFFFLLLLLFRFHNTVYISDWTWTGDAKIRAGNRPFITPYFFSRRPPITAALQNDE